MNKIWKEITFTPKGKVQVKEGVVVCPMNGTYPQIQVSPTGGVKGSVRMRLYGESPDTSIYRVLLPACYFSLDNKASLFSKVVAASGYPPDCHCVSVPLKLSDNEQYLYCSKEMFDQAMDEGNVVIQPMVWIDYSPKSKSLVQKGMVFSAGRSKNAKPYTIALQGRKVASGIIEKGKPTFRGLEFSTPMDGFYKLMGQLVEYPYKEEKTTILPRLRPYNFHNIAVALAEYWEHQANINGEECPFDLSYTGTSMDPTYNDDVLAFIRQSVYNYEPTPPSPVTQTVIRVQVPK